MFVRTDARFMERARMGRGGGGGGRPPGYNFPLFLVYPVDMPDTYTHTHWQEYHQQLVDVSGLGWYYCLHNVVFELDVNVEKWDKHLDAK